MQTHRVSFRGSYSDGNNNTRPYRIALNIPEQVIKNVNAIGYFKQQMRDTTSDTYKAFVKEYPDFERLASHNLEDISEVQHGN
jgi:hypothetical protein